MRGYPIMRRLMASILGLLMVLPATTALQAAGEYPERPIQMIVAFNPGGGTDVAARGIAR